MKTAIFFLEILFTAAQLFAQQPTILVTAPDSVQAGQLVRLDATASKADSLAWDLVTPSADPWYLDTGGEIAYFATRTPGNYAFVLMAASVDTNGKIGIALKTIVVRVSDDLPEPQPGPDPGPLPPVPPPGPDPDPQPTPAPDLPDGQYQLAKWAYQNALAVPDHRKATALSQSFSGIASRISAGTLRGADSIISESTKSNREALDNDSKQWDQWRPFFVALSDKLKSLRLRTDQEHATAWREIATGLAAVNGGE